MNYFIKIPNQQSLGSKAMLKTALHQDLMEKPVISHVLTQAIALGRSSGGWSNNLYNNLYRCTVKRVGIRTAYETVNIPLRIMGQIVFGLCACLYTDTGKAYQLKCNNTTAQPGLACTVPNMVYKSLFKSSFMLWNAYQDVSHTCFNPLNSIYG